MRRRVSADFGVRPCGVHAKKKKGTEKKRKRLDARRHLHGFPGRVSSAGPQPIVVDSSSPQPGDCIGNELIHSAFDRRLRVCVCVCVFTFIKVPETGGLGRRGWSRRRCGRRKNRHSNLCGVENGVCATQNGDAHGVGPNRTTDDDSSAAGGIVGSGRSRAGQVRPAPPATAAAATTTTTSSDRFAQHVRPLGRSAGRQQRGQMSVFPSLTCTGGGGGGGSFVRARVSPSHRDHSTRLTARTANRITLLLHQVAVRTWCAVLRRLLSVVLQRPRPAGGLDAARRSGY